MRCLGTFSIYNKNCLRHDANVVQITGIEGDYDLEKMPVSEAVERLEQAGIASMLYTSPSHTEDAPRWRVLCPTSVALPPTERDRLLARLNGVLGGVLSSESWTLSQSTTSAASTRTRPTTFN